MICTEPTHAPCEVCTDGTCIRIGRYQDLRVIAQDEDGFPVYDRDTGELKTVLLLLPVHVLTHSRLDPTGLVGVECTHGLPNHPDPEIDAWFKRKGARSFVRSRYSIPDGPHAGKCVMDTGVQVPNLITPRNG